MTEDIDDLRPTAELSARDVTSLVQLFNVMLNAMEGRIVRKIDDYAHSESRRWEEHAADVQRLTESWTTRAIAIETTIADLERRLDDHLDKEHDEEVRADARIRPVKTVAEWFVFHWRDLVILGIGIIALLGFLGDTLSHLLTGHFDVP